MDTKRKGLSFSDFKGFTQISDIRIKYRIGKILGEGSYG